MKGNTIKNFVVGLGFEYDDKGAREIDSSIDSIRGKALQLGAVVAGAFGINELTSGFAQANDTLGKFSDTLGLDANAVAAFGRALQHEGGSLESFLGQIESIERLRSGLLTGDAGWIGAAEAAGIDTDAIVNATNATEAYVNLADQFANMNRQQRLNAAEALGFDQASIRLLSKGREELLRVIAAEKNRRPVTTEMTKAAADFNDETQDLLNNIGRVADKISMMLLPAVNETIGTLNDWFETNQEAVDEIVESTPEKFFQYTQAAATAGPAGVARMVIGESRVNELITPDVRSTFESTLNVVTEVQKRQADPFRQLINPYASPIPIRIENKLELDGRTIGESVTEVVERIFTDTADEMESSVEG